MASEAQIKANQANAQYSTGPKTAEGKAISSRNNVRVGLTGDSFNVLAWEKQEEFDELLEDLRSEHKPATRTESLLVEKMAQSYWLSQRAAFLQKMCFDSELPMCRSTEEKVFALYMRYQTTHERNFHKALNELLRLRAEKRKLEIGFESQKQKQAADARRETNENRKQAAETRKQELHKFDVWLAEARAEHQELLNMNLETPENRVPNRIERIIARQKAA
jgi:low affinity Fe/Cu permease